MPSPGSDSWSRRETCDLLPMQAQAGEQYHVNFSRNVCFPVTVGAGEVGTRPSGGGACQAYPRGLHS